MVHFGDINQAPSPYSMLQHIGTVATTKLVPRNRLRYLQTTMVLGEGNTGQKKWSFPLRISSVSVTKCESPETMRKLCFSTKFPHQEIR